jgi:hypothetical protein
MEYKLEQVENNKYTVLYSTTVFIFFTRWLYVKETNSNAIRYFGSKRAAQAYINYQTNPNMKWK